MDRAFQRIRSLMLRGTFYSVPPIRKTGTAAEFATKVGVARSTFFEYMDYMRNELNIVILYDRSAKTYYYSNKGLYDSLKQWIA